MIWFEYKYLSFTEVLNNIKNINNYSQEELDILWASILVILILIVYLIPIIKVYNDERKRVKEKMKKREFLKKIALQKDIEDKIAQEINIK